MILTIGTGGSGLTFLNWTILFLRGDIIYTRLDNSTVPVDIDPLTGSIAHNFFKDHIQTPSNLSRLSLANEKSVVYVTLTHQKDFDYLQKFNCKKIVFDCKDKNKELFARMVTCIPNSNFSRLVADLADKFGLAESKQTLLECSKLFTKYYTVPAASDEYFIISYDDIFTNLDTKVHELFLFLGYKISPARFTEWLEIYKVYQIKNSKVLNNFLPGAIDVPGSLKSKIVKEVIKWNNGLCHHK